MSHTADDDEPTRRDFLYIATGATGVVAVGAAVWPLIDQMNPSADVLAQSTTEVDVSEVETGTEITVTWQGKPVFIRRRTEADIALSRDTPLEDLKDPIARNANIAEDAPATDEDRAMDDSGEWLVMVGICTHLGCVPLGGGVGDYKGWFCPCHGSHYDTAGRIRKGPAPRNLDIPPTKFLSDTVIKLG